MDLLSNSVQSLLLLVLFIAVVKVKSRHQQASLQRSETVAAHLAHLEWDSRVATCQTMLLAGCCPLAD